MSIRVLDCTLRDGGHLNQGKFGENVIKYIIQKLIEANTDIIEVGFLWDSVYGTDTARYYNISDVKRILPPMEKRGKSKFSLMADFIDLEHIEQCDGTIEYIRLSFKRHRLDWALRTLKILKDKGYKVFINPVNCNVYSDEEYLSVVRKINKAKPYGFSIVDTFGVMRLKDLSARYYLVENNLNKDISIGLHLHENLGLAYSLAQHFINIHSPLRNIVIDGSLLGMGRVPGNLPIEQIMDHLNVNLEFNYNLAPVYDAIDDFIAPIKEKNPWGYSIPYALSAQNNLHRTYAEYLMNKWKLKTSDIEMILKEIVPSKAELFDEEYVEKLYRNYLNVIIDDNKSLEILQDELSGKKILVIAPGSSISTVKERIVELEDSVIIIAVNFIPDFCIPNYVFFSNIKRYETEVVKKKDKSKVIITSNLCRSNVEYNFVVQYGRVVYHSGKYNDDTILMLLNLLKNVGIKYIQIAGFDGFKKEGVNFFNEQMDRKLNGEYKNIIVKEILDSVYKDFDIEYITPSQFSKKCNI